MTNSNKFKLKKGVAIAVLSVFLALFLILACTSLSPDNGGVYAYSAAIPQEIIADEYNVGTSINLPSEIEIEYNGDNVTATDGYIVYPNGTATYVGNIVLSQLGQYSVNYYFEADGKTHVVKKNFSVTDKLYSLSTDGGSIVAVSAEEQAGKTYTSADDNVLLTKQDGLIVRLADKNTFNYAKSIDITDVGEDGLCDLITLDYNLSNFALNPNYVEGTTASWKKYYPTKESAWYCVIRLTDSYDASNYVELFLTADFPYVGYPYKYDTSFNFLNDATYQSSYRGVLTARANSQTRTGMVPFTGSEWGGYKKINVNGRDYGAYIDNIFGTFSNMQLAQSLTQEHLPYTWAFDYKTNNVYVKVGNQTALVTSLSNSDLYGTDVFNGFSKDKVKLSIYMSDYISDKEGRIDITAIGKDSGSTLVQNFGKSGFIDDVALPEIEIDTELTDSSGIYAPLGYDFVLPKATVIGGDAKNSYLVSAYANYGSDLQVDVPVVNGVLEIKKNIQYSVVYSATNSVGGVGEYILKINPVSTVTDPITLNTDFNLTQIEAGDTVILPEYSVSTINRSDMLSVKIKAVHEKETIDVDIESGRFVPGYSGEYKIVYELSDNAYTVFKEFTVDCVASGRVGFSGNVVVPKYFIKDATYSLDQIRAYSYSLGYPKAIEVRAFINFDGTGFIPIEDTNKVKITGNSTAVIKYTCQQGNWSDEILSSTVKIVDVNYSQRNAIAFKNYFIHDGFTIKDFNIETNPKTDVKFDSIVQSGNNSLEFINAVSLTKLDVQFKTTSEYANYNAIKVVLTDYYDPTMTFSVEITDGNPYALTTVNGKNSVRSGYSFADNNVNKKVIYDNNLKKLTVNDVTYDLDLSSYFTSDLCYVTIELCDIYGSASVIIDSINGQGFRQKYSNNNDTIGPIITFEDFSGEYALGSVIKLSAPFVTDVLTPVLNKDISLTVMKDDKYLFSTSGVKLDYSCDPFAEYEIALNENGRYLITYTAIDGFGNEATVLCYVVVTDNTAPAIKFVENYGDKITVSLNQTVDLSVRVYDDYTADKDIVTNVLIQDLKSGAFYSIADYKIKFAYTGEFEVYVTAKDQTGNFSSVTLKITVTA